MTDPADDTPPTGEWDPGEHSVDEVREYLAANPGDVDRVMSLEREGKARKGVLDHAPFDPSKATVEEVLEHLADASPEETERVLRLEADGKARKGVLERAEPGGLGPLGATTVLREDYMGRNVIDPTGVAKDYMGRVTTATADSTGRNLRRTIRSPSLVVSLNQELQYADGTKYLVTTAGTLHATVPPASPAVGATVADGTAVLTRQR